MPLLFIEENPAVGTTLPVRKSYGQNFDPSNGYLFTELYQGIDEVQMANLQNSFASSGVASSLEFAQGIASLRTNDATQQFAIDTWEILGNSERKDLFTHPLVVQSIYAIAPRAVPVLPSGSTLPAGWSVQDNVGFIMQCIRFALAGGDSTALAFYGAGSGLAPWNFPPASSFTGDPTTNGIVQRMYALNRIGTDEYDNAAYAGGYVLRHSTNISNRAIATITYGDINAGRIYSTAELITEVASGWNFNLPQRMILKLQLIDAIGAIVMPVQAGYVRGWLKSRSTETTTARNRVNVTVDYTFEQWQADIYIPL